MVGLTGPTGISTPRLATVPATGLAGRPATSRDGSASTASRPCIASGAAATVSLADASPVGVGPTPSSPCVVTGTTGSTPGRVSVARSVARPTVQNVLIGFAKGGH